MLSPSNRTNSLPQRHLREGIFSVSVHTQCSTRCLRWHQLSRHKVCYWSCPQIVSNTVQQEGHSESPRCPPVGCRLMNNAHISPYPYCWRTERKQGTECQQSGRVLGYSEEVDDDLSTQPAHNDMIRVDSKQTNLSAGTVSRMETTEPREGRNGTSDDMKSTEVNILNSVERERVQSTHTWMSKRWQPYYPRISV